jgi:hypothetical protein
MIAGEPFMKLKLVATISAFAAIPALAHAQQSGPAKTSQLTKADVQNVVQIISSDKAKTQAYCDLSKLNDQIAAAQQANDTNNVETLTKQADALVANLGPQYSKMIEKLGEVDLTSSKGNELSAIILGLDKLCTE